MKQPIKRSLKKVNRNKLKLNIKKKIDENLDGSKLETFFKENILKKLKVNYEQQFEAKSIGRFYDFLLTDSRILIEIDGTYWHMDPRVYESGPINSIQKRNKRVDEVKDKWALINGYVLLRFWEKDIYNDTKSIINLLSERINSQEKVVLLEKSKKDGSFFMKKK